MFSQRASLSHFAAVALCACACLFISGGPVAEAQTPPDRRAGEAAPPMDREKAATAQQAAHRAEGYRLLIKPADLARSNSDADIIYRNVAVTSAGEQVKPDFALPRETFCALLSRQLAQY